MAQYPAPTHCSHSISIQCFYPVLVPTILSQILEPGRKIQDQQYKNDISIIGKAAQYWTLVQSYLVVYVYLFPSSDTWEAVTEAQGDWWPANVCLIFSHSLSVFAWQGLHDTVCARVTCDQCPQCPAPWSHGLGSHRMCLVSVPGTRHIVIITALPLGTPAFSVLCVMTTI